MPQLNRRYPRGAAKRRKKEERIKADEKCKGFLDRFVVVQVVLVSLQSRVQLEAPKLLIVANSYVCLVQWFPTFSGLRHPTEENYNLRQPRPATRGGKSGNCPPQIFTSPCIC